MKSQVLHALWCNISGEAAGEIWHWSPLEVKELNTETRNDKNYINMFQKWSNVT